MEPLRIKTENVRYLGYGEEAIVYSIGGNRVVKVPHANQDQTATGKEIIERLMNEHIVGRNLHNGGISVPISFGIFYLKVDWRTLGPSLLMEEIDGVSFEILRGRGFSQEYQRLEKLADIEIEKARELGFYARDSNNPRNKMLSRTGRVYLIDFGQWRKIN